MTTMNDPQTLRKADCQHCGGPLARGKEHIPQACIEILKWKLDESERERLVAQETVKWLEKNHASAVR